MKNLRELGFILGVGTIVALTVGGCSDDATPTPGTSGTGTTAGTGTSGSGTAGSGTAGTGTSGTGTGGSGTAGSGTAGMGGAKAGAGGGGAGGMSGGTGGGGAGGGGGKAGGGGMGGGGGSGGGAGPMCADIDGPATESATCTTYCADAVPTCGANTNSEGKVADMDKCMTFCKTFSMTQLCCRAYHVKNAKMGMPDSHCKHTIGVESCQ
jgi:hypothetical protein